MPNVVVEKFSIEIQGDPAMHAACHCSNCRKRTGSAFGISAYFNNEQVVSEPTGLHLYQVYSAELSTDQERFFCGTCGTTLYWRLSNSPDMVGIAGGCFVDDPLPTPELSTSQSQKFSWVSLSDSCAVIE
ncbi:MAG: GFA family protein [Pseudomonadales bacterium]|nr:GFA family protein [Pseudomonadales bacterium]